MFVAPGSGHKVCALAAFDWLKIHHMDEGIVLAGLGMGDGHGNVIKVQADKLSRVFAVKFASEFICQSNGNGINCEVD